MNGTFKMLFVFTLLFSSVCMSETVVISSKLKIDYPNPSVILHDNSSIIFKFEGWFFSHEIVDPKNIYQRFDLTGIDKMFIKSIFSGKKISPLWLNNLAKEQASDFGVTESNVESFKKGLAEVVGVYNEKDQTGQIFIIEMPVIHKITVKGKKGNFNLILHNILEM